MRINEDIAEKPDHLHYPACLGRKQEIDKKSFQIFAVTFLSCLLLSFCSLIGMKFTVPYIIPEILCGTDEVKASFVQIAEFMLLAGVSLLGCTKFKIADVIVLMTNILFLAVTLIAKENPGDFLIIILSAYGIFKSYDAFSLMRDYEQLRNTEGFPIFSLILAEYEQKLNSNAADPSVFRNASGSSTMDDASEKVPQVVFSGNSDTDMPALSPVNLTKYTYNEKRYMPKTPKVSGIIESPIRTR